MATLKSLVDETTDIKNEIVNCYDNLKNNLTNKKIDLTGNEKILNLIDKVNDLSNMEIGVYTEAPTETPKSNTGVAIITDITPQNLYLSYKKPELNEGDIWIKIKEDENFSYRYSYTVGNISIPFDIFNVYQQINGLLEVTTTYVVKDGAWVILFEPYKPVYEDGLYVGEFSNRTWKQYYSRNGTKGTNSVEHRADGIYVTNSTSTSSSTSQMGGNYSFNTSIYCAGYTTLKFECTVINRTSNLSVWANVLSQTSKPPTDDQIPPYSQGIIPTKGNFVLSLDCLSKAFYPTFSYYTQGGSFEYVIKRIYFERPSTYLTDEEVRVAELEEENELLRQELLITKNMINELTLNNAKEIDNIIE